MGRDVWEGSCMYYSDKECRQDGYVSIDEARERLDLSYLAIEHLVKDHNIRTTRRPNGYIWVDIRQMEARINYKSKTPQPKYKTHWPEFADEMKTRLIEGHEEYGDKSFDLSPWELIENIKQETMDIVGWGFILWTRLQKLEEKVGKIKDD